MITIPNTSLKAPDFDFIRWKTFCKDVKILCYNTQKQLDLLAK